MNNNQPKTNASKAKKCVELFEASLVTATCPTCTTAMEKTGDAPDDVWECRNTVCPDMGIQRMWPDKS